MWDCKNVNVILNQNNELNDKQIPVILFDTNQKQILRI